MEPRGAGFLSPDFLPHFYRPVDSVCASFAVTYLCALPSVTGTLTHFYGLTVAGRSTSFFEIGAYTHM